MRLPAKLVILRKISFLRLSPNASPQSLSVRTDEVAILGVSHRWRHLHFVVPEALKKCRLHPTFQQKAR